MDPTCHLKPPSSTTRRRPERSELNSDNYPSIQPSPDQPPAINQSINSINCGDATNYLKRDRRQCCVVLPDNAHARTFDTNYFCNDDGDDHHHHNDDGDDDHHQTKTQLDPFWLVALGCVGESVRACVRVCVSVCVWQQHSTANSQQRPE